MRIVHVQSYFQPHLGYQEYYFCKYMALQGHDVHMITSDRFMPFKGLKNSKGRIVGTGEFKQDLFTIHRLPLYFEFRTRVLLNGFVRKLKNLNPDLIFLHGSTNLLNLFVIFNKSFRNCKIVIDEHHMSIVASNSIIAFIYWKIWALVFKRIIKNQLVKIVGVAPDCCNLLSDKLNIPFKRIDYIPLGADRSIFNKSCKLRTATRKSLCYGSNDIIVVYTGKINSEKDPFLILRAFKDVDSYKQIKFLFVGNISHEYLEENTDLINHHNVKILPSVTSKELAGIYNGCDIACWPKHASLSSIEAASCGLPIIVNEIVSERVKNSNGYSIRDNDPIDLQNKILKLVKSPILRNEMGLKGIDFVKANHCYRKLSNDIISLFK